MTKLREITYAEAIAEAISQSMEKDPSVFIIGEGVPDPKAIFGTTKGLVEKYGSDRVLDMPVSENALTGVCIGTALRGMRPIMVHQRLDFVLLAMDQIVNNSAKWHYMFGGQTSVPFVVRAVIGMGWGQGAQHSQNIQAIFTHIPGLKVVMPATPYDAKGLLISSIQDNNPVIFIEHRWLHHIRGHVPTEMYNVPIGKAEIIKDGKDITIASTSYMTIEALNATKVLEEAGVSAEIIDIRTLKPLDDSMIIDSVKKTGRLLAVDSGYYTGGFAGEIIARISEKAFEYLKVPPQRITLPDIPSPSTPALTKYYYPRHIDIIQKVCQMTGKPTSQITHLIELERKKEPQHLDVPNKEFTGPF
ncbi:alpha-ketoacid dehydrogenase subunit beta [Candidatus Woesearchaeota archaeon]|nr:alpha-ketoacid dehydrogenase subunit beta [Candidatus Woesearchaeota archaeon]